MVAAAEVSQKLLRLEEIERKPKRIHLARGFIDRVAIGTLGGTFEADLLKLRQCITTGVQLPSRFYRRGKGIDDDPALSRFGIMHLHLGGQGSDVLVFLMQFAEDVILLEINNHRPFQDIPPARTLRYRHWPQVAALLGEVWVRLAEVATSDAERVRTKNADLRKRLGLKP